MVKRESMVRHPEVDFNWVNLSEYTIPHRFEILTMT